jgi:hypothetical protein
MQARADRTARTLATVQPLSATKPAVLRLRTATTPPLSYTRRARPRGVRAKMRRRVARTRDDPTHCAISIGQAERTACMSDNAQPSNATETFPPIMDTTPVPCTSPDERLAAAALSDAEPCARRVGYTR